MSTRVFPFRPILRRPGRVRGAIFVHCTGPAFPDPFAARITPDDQPANARCPRIRAVPTQVGMRDRLAGRSICNPQSETRNRAVPPSLRPFVPPCLPLVPSSLPLPQSAIRNPKSAIDWCPRSSPPPCRNDMGHPARRPSRYGRGFVVNPQSTIVRGTKGSWDQGIKKADGSSNPES